jgi:hypothetical protein
LLSRLATIILAAIITTWAAGSAEVVAEDEAVRTDTENCLLCHRYPSMGRFDESGVKRIFYVNGEKFAHSIHGKLKCTACHVGLDKIPHTDVKKVDCTTQCHIKEPSTEKEFSHQVMSKQYVGSAHGQGTPENPKPFPEDLPTCKYCHKNRLQTPPDGFTGQRAALANETLARCGGCHTQEQWAKIYYTHFANRTRHVRSQPEIVALCIDCHADKEKMARHGLESVATFKETFHWNLVKYETENAPDCISCHVASGDSAHDVKPGDDPESSVYILNRVSTCSNQGGVRVCHPKATPEFASGRVHAYGTKAQIAAGFGKPEFEGANQDKLIERAHQDMSEEEVFRYKILTYIRWFYRLFIPMVIGFMAYHQWMDFLSARRERKKSRKRK